MSILQEALEGTIGDLLLDELHIQHVRARGAVTRSARHKDVGDIRYAVGIADGIERTMEVINSIRKGDHA